MKTILALFCSLACLCASAQSFTFSDGTNPQTVGGVLCLASNGPFASGWIDSALGESGLWDVGESGAVYVTGLAPGTATVTVSSFYDGQLYLPPLVNGQQAISGNVYWSEFNFFFWIDWTFSIPETGELVVQSSGVGQTSGLVVDEVDVSVSPANKFSGVSKYDLRTDAN